MKILHVITSLQTGGAEKLMVDLLPRLSDRGHEVELAVFDGRITPFYDQLSRRGITIHRFMSRGGNVYNPINLYRLIRLLRRKRWDVVHTHNTSPQLFAAVAGYFTRAKLVTTEHNTTNRRREWGWYGKVDRWMYGRYDKVICISAKAEERLREYLGEPGRKICTINNGVEVGRFATAGATDELERLAPGSRKIIMVAGFRQQKDQDTLIRSLGALPAAFHLFLVGDGERRQELEALSRSEGVAHRVHFLGVRMDIAGLLHAADYVVMTSHHEGLSLSSVEGMSVGKPFLASDVDGLHDVVEGAGILIPHRDADALAAEILALEETPERYTAVAEACRVRAGQYDIAAMAVGYNEAYLSL